jgi:hypothetical protein
MLTKEPGIREKEKEKRKLYMSRSPPMHYAAVWMIEYRNANGVTP